MKANTKSLVQGLQLQANADTVPLPGANTMASIIRTIQYLPQALQYVAHHCKHLEELSLRLSQIASSRRGGAWHHPSLLKRPHFKLSQFWSHCTSLQSLTLVNVPSRYDCLCALDVYALKVGQCMNVGTENHWAVTATAFAQCVSRMQICMHDTCAHLCIAGAQAIQALETDRCPPY